MTRNSTKRDRLYEEQNGKCCYCGCHAVIINYKNPAPSVLPDNLATLEHLDNRLSDQREDGQPARYAMACFRCNQEQGRLYQKKHFANKEKPMKPQD